MRAGEVTALGVAREQPGARSPGLLVAGATVVATMAGGLRRGGAQADPATITGPDLAVACWEGTIVAAGARRDVLARLVSAGHNAARFELVDAAGGTVTPGLIDPHTHLVFAGSREGEIELRQRGAGYLEILAAGGGILSTVARTRAATRDELLRHGRAWLAEMLSHGTTTIEAKSGYGLSREHELRQLAVAAELGAEGPVEVVPTFLGAHAVGPEFRDRPGFGDGAARTEAYVRDVIEDQLPAVAAQGVARFCDVFCEQGVFDADQSRRILRAGAGLGLVPRLHADELQPSGGAELAAEIGAASADHLGAPSAGGIAALARSAASASPVVATLLPATSFYLKAEAYGPARELIDRGVPVALGTDFNPGTSPVASLPLVCSIAVLRMGLRASEALAAVTINAAHALRLGATHGSIETGKQADLVVWNVPALEQIPYWVGAGLVRAVVKRGEVVFTGR